MFFEEAPFLALFGLASFAVVAPLDGISHGRHGVGYSGTTYFLANCRLERQT